MTQQSLVHPLVESSYVPIVLAMDVMTVLDIPNKGDSTGKLVIMSVSNRFLGVCDAT